MRSAWMLGATFDGIGRRLRQGSNRLTKRRQPIRPPRRLRNVVEADDRTIVGHFAASLMTRRIDETQREQVGDAEDAVARPSGEQFERRRASGDIVGGRALLPDAKRQARGLDARAKRVE